MPFEDDVHEEIEGYSDAAELLTNALHEFLEEQGDRQRFKQQDIKEYLETHVQPYQLSIYMTNQFSRGILVGQYLQFQNILIELENEDLEDED
jgi:hypothetical protein